MELRCMNPVTEGTELPFVRLVGAFVENIRDGSRG